MYFRSLRKQAFEVSLSEPIDSDKEGNALSLLDVISSDDTMLEEIDLSDRQRLLHLAIDAVLEPREKAVIIARYGLAGAPPLTQREVAAKHDISRSYISRIEKRALIKLHKQLKDDT
jgi:RNA polymerase sporulation-specific sigma factor